MKKEKGTIRFASFGFYFSVLMALCLRLLVVIVSLTNPAQAQTGGTFDLSHAVIASGGDSNSAGGNFTIDGTPGQTSAGTVSTGGGFSLRGGFWAFNALVPTSAMVSVSGRIRTANGQGIRNIRVTLINAGGLIRMTQTGTFGYFRFNEIEAGQIYILEVSSKKYIFANPTRILSVQEEIADADFVAESQ